MSQNYHITYGDLSNGKGIKQLEDGSLYIGSYQNSVEHGKGIYLSQHGILQIVIAKKGSLKKHLFIKNTNISVTTRELIIEENKYGIIRYNNGDLYIGEVREYPTNEIMPDKRRKPSDKVFLPEGFGMTKFFSHEGRYVNYFRKGHDFDLKPEFMSSDYFGYYLGEYKKGQPSGYGAQIIKNDTEFWAKFKDSLNGEGLIKKENQPFKACKLVNKEYIML